MLSETPVLRVKGTEANALLGQSSQKTERRGFGALFYYRENSEEFMFDFKVLSAEDVAGLLDMRSVIASNEAVYRQRAEGDTSTWPTVFNIFEEGAADLDIKSGWLKGAGVFGHKTVGWYGRNAQKGLPALVGLICVYDVETGAPLGVLDGTYITGIRTGAAGGIGAKLLARPDSRTLLVVGAGGQCAFQTAAVLELMEHVDRVIVANPHRPEAAVAKAASLPAEVAARGVRTEGVSFEAADDLEAACGAADIIVTCTMSRAPMIERSWVRPGTHLSCIGADMEGKIEIDPQIIADALLFVDDTAHCIEAGEIEVGIKQGAFGADHIAGEIGELLEGSKQGRTSDDQITVFDATGMALLDIACAKTALDLASGTSTGVDARI